MRGQMIENLTWKEAEALFQKKPTPVIVLPIGAQSKEHGLHLPLNNDWITAQYLARRVVDALPVIVLPTIPYGYFPAFVEYPGSVSIRKDVFRDFVIDICQSIARHGPKKFYVLNNGVSTNHSLEPARQELAKLGIQMEYTDLLTATTDVVQEVKQQEHGTHADEIETSMMLYLAPEVVRMSLAQKDAQPDRPGALTRDPDSQEGVYSPTGAWGDPTLATREKGLLLVEALVNHIVKFIEDFSREDFQPSPERKLK